MNVSSVNYVTPDDNSSRSRLSLSLIKPALAVLALSTTILLLTGLVVWSSDCSPVSLHLKVGALEYQLQKGSCNIPQLPPQ